MSLKCWLRVANDYFPASNFDSSWCMGLIQSGVLSALQVNVRKYLARKPGSTMSVFIGIYFRYDLKLVLVPVFFIRRCYWILYEIYLSG